MNTTPNKALQKSFPFEASVINDSLGEFAGYASTWSVDDKKEQMAPGAFSKSLARAEAKRVAGDRTFLYSVTWYHFSDQPLGGIYEAYEDSHGLFVSGLIDLTTKVGKRAFSGLKKGYIDGLSIQGFVNKDSYKGAVRQIDELELVAIGVGLFPVNRDARVLSVKSAKDVWLESMINDMASVASRYGAQARSKQVTNYDRPAFDGRDGRSRHGESYRIEYGRPEESRVEFEKELRKLLREEDPDLHNLVPGGKAYQREVERRQQERTAKQKAQREALEAERKAMADARIETLETYTVEQLAAKSGIDLTWLTRFVQVCIARGEVTPAVPDTLILRGCDYGTLGKRHHEEFETQFVSAARKRAERLEREKRGE